MSKKFPFKFSIQANATSDLPAEIGIRGVIGESFDPETWSMRNTETEVLNELSQIPKGKKINVRINSPGGDIGVMLGCYNAFAPRYDDITCYNEGFACSSASVLMLAGKNRVSPTSCVWMIHCASSGTYGNAEEHQRAISMLNACDDTMCEIYAKVAGGTKEEWMAKMKAETWFTGSQARECGIANMDGDEISSTPEIEMTTEAKRIVATFKHIPKNLQSRFTVTAQAANPPPQQTNQQTESDKMKKVIAALVALGFSCAENADENVVATLVTSSVTGLRQERDGFKTQVDGHVNARKNRVTAAVEKAAVDKLIPETRKTSMIAIGCATEEGEAEIVAQLAELTAHKTTPARGAAPVPRGTGTGEGDTIESLLEQQQEAIKTSNSEESARINGLLKTKRGRADMWKEEREGGLRPAYPNRN